MASWKLALALALPLLLTACRDGGHLVLAEADPEFNRKPSGFDVVTASAAVVTANDFTAKLQVNAIAGVKLQATNGYGAMMKFTVRNRE